MSNPVPERAMLASFTDCGRPKKMLVVLHQAHSTTGRVGRLLKSLGFLLEPCYPALGQALPASLTDYAGVVVFGGPMCANDGDAWLRNEIDWLRVPLREGKPFLGLCLGAQLMARQLGARVHSAESHRGELGYYPLRPAPGADDLCGSPFPRHAYQWHHDGFDIPHGADKLAEGEGDFPNQAFIYGDNVVGLQFHPEVTYQMICRWTTRGAAKLANAGARPHEHREGWFRYDRALDHWIAAFLHDWSRDALNWPRAEASAGLAIAAE
jgi:GMP synthase (glutamine-hydrolysing)